MGESGFEPGPHHLAHERRWRVVGAARATLVGIHHAFKHTAEHVGSDELAGVVLADGEVESLEQIIERVTPVAVAPDGRAVLPLQHRRLEQAAIEEWDRAQRARRCAALRRRPIQRAKTERVEEGAMKVAPGSERPIE